MSTDTGQGEPFKRSIAPWLSVLRGAEAVEFYKAAFGATELHRAQKRGRGDRCSTLDRGSRPLGGRRSHLSSRQASAGPRISHASTGRAEPFTIRGSRRSARTRSLISP